MSPGVASAAARRLFRLVACCLLVGGIAGCRDQIPQLPVLAPDAVVLAFGDSITHGTGAAQGEGYPERLAQLIGRRVINAGVPGELSAQGRQRLPELVERYRPDLVILCHGGNDMLQRKDLGRAADNIAAMVETAQAAGAQVLLVAVPKPRLLTGPDPMYRQLGERFRVPVLVDTLTDILTDRDLKADPVHPNAAGYTVLAREAARLLARAGAISSAGPS